MSSGLRETGRPGGRGLGRAQIVDVAIALAAFVAVLLLLRAHYRVENPGQRELDLLGVALAAASTLPLLAWRRAPLAVFSATTIASTLLLSEGYGPGLPVGPTVALFLLAASRDSLHPWTTRITLTVAVLFLAHLAAAALSHGQLPIVPVLFGTLGWTLAWFAGDRARLRREHLLELRERAARTEREAERERRLAAVEERMRIARDLHDSAGHAINVILVQTAAARLLQTRDSVRSRAALETIEQVARSTLADIDALVASLRDDSQNGHVQTPVGLAGIGALVASHRASGLEVSIETAGTGTALPSRVDQSAYRILQEALTNAARHGAGTARAEIAFRAQRLEITVTNPMRPGASIAPRLRHGLTGMRERAALLGGEFEAGGHGKTFVVHASLPLKRGKRLSEERVRVLIVDDDDLMRAGLRSVLSSDPSIQVVGEASSGRSGIDRARALRPDLVLMDIRMPDLDGIAATRQLLDSSAAPKVVMLTTFDEDDYVFGGLSAGASGFLLKRTPAEELIAAIQVIAAGDSLLSPSVTRRVIARVARESPEGDAERLAGLDELTPREREVLMLVARGLSNAEIAAELVVEASTVKTHVRHVLQKLDLRDRVQAVIFAHEAGLLRRRAP